MFIVIRKSTVESLIIKKISSCVVWQLREIFKRGEFTKRMKFGKVQTLMTIFKLWYGCMYHIKLGSHYWYLFQSLKSHIHHHTMREMLWLSLTTCMFQRSDWLVIIRWAQSHPLIGRFRSRDTNHQLLLVGNYMKRMKVRQSCSASGPTAWSCWLELG